MQQGPDIVGLIVETCVCLHNLMRIRYPTLRNAQLDIEGDDHNVIPGEWRKTLNLQDLNVVVRPNRDTTAVKRQRQYLKLYFNSAAGSVPSQDKMIRLSQQAQT
ncbi:hypothetical protein HOLleu_03948 [Holothuria leucospilota]|uniref:Uncharacterized protein n=1 Tax=Holothuria leucospilota TaxID=206669 RepID=A0A9Q1CU52_HOLLE|nr:hypothetical protein HOLleu_03948 [Holothuria leucospilota]